MSESRFTSHLGLGSKKYESDSIYKSAMFKVLGDEKEKGDKFNKNLDIKINKKENDDNSKANIKSSSSSSKKRKPKLINKTLAIRMFSVLLFHTGVLTIAEYIIHAIQKRRI